MQERQPADPCAAVEDDQEPELFFNEQEVLSGADADQRAAMLQHFDSLLQEPGPDPVDQVGQLAHLQGSAQKGAVLQLAVVPAPLASSSPAKCACIRILLPWSYTVPSAHPDRPGMHCTVQSRLLRARPCAADHRGPCPL